jgi:hypothetical protein
VYVAACAYVRAGLSLIPVARGGKKLPAGRLLPEEWDEDEAKYKATWNPFKGYHDKSGQWIPGRLPTDEELRKWFGGATSPGIGVIGGAVSGNLETIDFDHRADEVFPEWCARVEAEAPGPIDRLCVVCTPREPAGYHVRYRCSGATIPGNTVLAEDPTQPRGKRVLIETRGEGGYALAPGSPSECHENNRPYLHQGGPKLSQVQDISAAEREVLWRCAAAFDLRPVEEEQVKSDTFKGKAAGRTFTMGVSPGDDFNARGWEWDKILTGWTLAAKKGKEHRWRRPGKEDGWSATTGVCFSKVNKWELLKVFSSNAEPFEAGKTYNKFGAYARMHHNGDFKAAAQALYVLDYGTQRKEQGGSGQQTSESASPPPDWEQPIPLSHLPGVEAFPLEVLPEGLRRFVVEVARALNCPVDLVAVPLLGMAGGAIGNSRYISITRTHRQPANLFAAVISRPGGAKSPAQRILRQPFDAEQERRLSVWRAEMEPWKKKDKKGCGDRPVLRRCLVADVTTESLALTLEENDRGVLMLRDELMELVGGLNQYKGGKGYDRQVYLKLWDGEPLTIDRKSDKSRDGAPLYVPRPFASIVGGLQPGILDRFRGESTRFSQPPDDGFLDRWLLSFPEDLPAVGEKWLEVSDEAMGCWNEAVEWLLRLEMVQEEDQRPRPYFLDLTADARRAWQGFTEEHAAELNDPEFPPHLRGPWAKFRGYCGRLALILHALRWACGRPEIEDF